VVKYVLKANLAGEQSKLAARKWYLDRKAKPYEKKASSRGAVVTDQQVQEKNTRMLASQFDDASLLVRPEM
jgi:hypothetical protein